ncbi:MAG: response regulator transcription factor [Phycisphaerales bacterium]
MNQDHARDNGLLVLVDDDPHIRNALSQLLQSAGYSVKACDSAESASDMLERVEPDVHVAAMLLDVSLPGRSGLELLAELAERTGLTPPVVMISGHSDVPHVVDALRHGAADFLLKPLQPGDVIKAIDRAVTEHRRKIEAERARRSANELVDRLTPRERQILNLIVDGRLNKQMAVELDISQKTVEFHRARVMRKLEVTCMAELMRVAFLADVRSLVETVPTTTSHVSSEQLATA